MSPPTISSFFHAGELVQKEPNHYNVIVTIDERLSPYYINNKRIFDDKALCHIVEYFDDISYPQVGYFCPQKKQIENLLNFAENKDNIICACWAGISRSSGMAYVIESSRSTPSKALAILSYDLHRPNELVIRHGSEILDLPEMIDLISDWTIECRRRSKYNW